MNKTAIQWTDLSANTIRARNKATNKVGWHCVMVSPGCANCYSHTLNGRFGTHLPYAKASKGRVDLFLDTKPLEKLRKLKKPSRVFLNDMTDMFADFVSDEWLDTMFGYMALSWQHTFQILTKRADRMRKYISDPATQERVLVKAVLCSGESWCEYPLMTWPLANVWLGVSCEDQKRADERIPDLLGTPAAIRFLSLEPLLGSIDLADLPGGQNAIATISVTPGPDGCGIQTPCKPPIDWAIVGGESGPGARPCEVKYIGDIVRDCKDAGVPVFVKQYGSNPIFYGSPIKLKDKKGGDPEEWLESLRVREFPK